MSTREPFKRQARPRSPGVDVRPGSVRDARLEAGLSLAKLAGQDLSRGAIYLIESGRSRPSIATLKLIASRTRKPISFFLDSEAGLEPQVSGSFAVDVGAAERLCLSGELERAVSYCEAVLAEVIDPYAEAWLRVCLGRATLGLGRPEEARAQLEQARTQLAGLDDPWLLADCRTLLAAAALAAHEPDSLALAEEAIAACQALDPVPRPTLARAHTMAGDVFAAEQRWQEAVQHYQLGLEHASAHRTLRQLSELYEALSQAHERRHRSLQAAGWSMKATALQLAQDDLGILATIHLKLGDALLGRHQPGPALHHLQEALVECDRLYLEEGKARVLLAQAHWSMTQGQAGEAEKLARQSAELAERVGERRCLAFARCLLGRLAAADGDVAGRDREFGAAFALLAELGDREQLIDAHAAYAELLEVSGQVSEALNEWKQAVKLSRPHLEHLSPPASTATVQ
jgi:tetratricopeptide (TPR) repeat protein